MSDEGSGLKGFPVTWEELHRHAKALSWRNQRLMQIKNDDLGAYIGDLPWIMRRELLSIAFIIVFDPRRLRAVLPTLRLAPAAMRKRLYLQRQIRRVSGRR